MCSNLKRTVSKTVHTYVHIASPEREILITLIFKSFLMTVNRIAHITKTSKSKIIYVYISNLKHFQIEYENMFEVAWITQFIQSYCFRSLTRRHDHFNFISIYLFIQRVHFILPRFYTGFDASIAGEQTTSKQRWLMHLNLC